ncbi:MAG: hypothetical protein ACT4NU_02215 [Chromatiales bacterium]
MQSSLYALRPFRDGIVGNEHISVASKFSERPFAVRIFAEHGTATRHLHSPGECRDRAVDGGCGKRLQVRAGV